jgi:hypothetical protein
MAYLRFEPGLVTIFAFRDKSPQMTKLVYSYNGTLTLKTTANWYVLGRLWLRRIPVSWR